MPEQRQRKSNRDLALSTGRQLLEPYIGTTFERLQSRLRSNGVPANTLESPDLGLLNDLLHQQPQGNRQPRQGKRTPNSVVWKVVWFDGLNVRSAPSGDGEVVGELDMDDTVEQLEMRDGWVRHSKGWNAVCHPEVPELRFLELDGGNAAGSALASYEQQRASMEKQELEMVEQVMEASRNAAPQVMDQSGCYKPVVGLLPYLEVQNAKLQLLGEVHSSGFSTDTSLWYYGCAPTNDKSWGCAYRCAQMLFECCAKQLQIKSFQVPTLLHIQHTLATAGTVAPSGKTITHADVGSTNWIEPPLVAALLRDGSILEQSVMTVDFELVRNNCECGAPAVMAQYLQQHFSPQGPRTVVMCDDYTFAYTVAAIRARDQGLEVLLFDPHLSTLGLEDGLTLSHFVPGSAALSTLRCSSPCEPEKGPARWVSLDRFFDRNKWMVCFPVLQCTDHRQLSYLGSVRGVENFTMN